MAFGIELGAGLGIERLLHRRRPARQRPDAQCPKSLEANAMQSDCPLDLI
jgi:hypothetical protein